MVDAKTGKILWGLQEPSTHIHGRACADIDPRYPGVESYQAKQISGEALALQREGRSSIRVTWEASLRARPTGMPTSSASS